MKDLPLGVLTWLRMARFVRTSNQISNDALRRHGLSVAQFELLGHVHAYGPVTQSDLAQGLTLTGSGISRMIDRLERDGLVRRDQEWKTKHVSLTPAGLARLEEVHDAQVDLQASLFDEALTPAERKQLHALVKKLYDHADAVRARR